jgi:hypothetical protein
LNFSCHKINIVGRLANFAKVRIYFNVVLIIGQF